jgi:type II secretory pathway pseudopilin PulG
VKRNFHHPRVARKRGSALVLVMIILGVLALLAAAALKLAQQDSVNVNQRISRETLTACAEAAQRKLMAEIALRGGATGQVQAVVVPGANTQLVVGHYDSEAVVNVDLDKNFLPLGPAAASGGFDENDATNTMRMGGMFGQQYFTVAHCTDARGRQYEVEVIVRWM